MAETVPDHLSANDRRARDPLRLRWRRACRMAADAVPFAPLRSDDGQRRFVIFGVGRNGTTLLADLLDANDGVVCDGEIFNGWRTFPARVLTQNSQTHAPAAYGFKILSYQLTNILALPRPEAFFDWLEASGFRIVYVRRENILRHIISQINARRAQFHARGEVERRPIVVERGDLLFWREIIERRLGEERALLSGRRFCEVIYERDLEDAVGREAAMERLASFLDLPLRTQSTALRKITETDLAKQIANYDDFVGYCSELGLDRWLEPAPDAVASPRSAEA